MKFNSSQIVKGISSLSAIALSITVLGLPGLASFAQDYPDYGAEPLFGEFNLDAGFRPDPYNIDVVAGGTNNASDFNLGPDCMGYIAAAQPDIRVNYTAGDFELLSIYVASDVDTTLVINGPDGSWYCNDDDDTEGSVNPRVMFSYPTSGRYDIWVGTFHDEANPAQIRISETWVPYD
ncbi:hypothetical protein VB712_02725 [Spirulina sp. CCNP1310]|uniref:hypothetical protein n=1 Tax=Spirulina sp. CCNP1310 TaxID=3110249 RepID=UPI002B1E9EEC|nr:hypothetical protein [Spirulina sp. CCNP1310]MEA5418121.1 hypothetical protein [Spirulina sp. CCNP1310]